MPSMTVTKKGKTEKHDEYTAVVQELEDRLQEAKRGLLMFEHISLALKYFSKSFGISDAIHCLLL